MPATAPVALTPFGHRSVLDGERPAFRAVDPENLSPLLVDAKGAARLCGIGVTLWRELHVSGRCPLPVRLARRVLWRTDELRDWVSSGCVSREVWMARKGANR